MSEHYSCGLCGARDYGDYKEHEKSARHRRAGANMALEIVYRFKACPWCGPKNGRNTPFSKCKNAEHKAMLKECEKLAGDLAEISPGGVTNSL